MITDVIIIHLHELTLKGKNRNWFERTLLSNIRTHLRGLKYSDIINVAGRIVITNIDISQYDTYKENLKSLIGIRNFIFASHCDLDIDIIKERAITLCRDIDDSVTFRVSSRRQNKNLKTDPTKKLI